ncbi:MAG: hypothetical protein GTN70_08470 [Deltaproteobacteria bacterium]|nr:hypothetical protein [Deltaproteobacteria bacterium]NIS77799.1 hypothetical protein [Deltaproteobacteria bacterium]
MLRRRDRIPPGGIHDDDAVFRGRADIDVVYTDASPPDDLESLYAAKDLSRDFRPAPDDDGVVGVDHFFQLLGAHLALHVDIYTLASHKIYAHRL